MKETSKAWFKGLFGGAIHGLASTIVAWGAMASAKGVGWDVPALNLKALGIMCVVAFVTHAAAFLMKSPLPGMTMDEVENAAGKIASVFLIGFLSLSLVGCASLQPGTDPLVVRAEQTQTIAKSAFDNVLAVEYSNLSFWRTNAPGFYKFCEWLKQPQAIPGRMETLPRDYALLWNLDAVKIAYKQSRASSNALMEIIATVSETSRQAAAWATVIQSQKP